MSAAPDGAGRPCSPRAWARCPSQPGHDGVGHGRSRHRTRRRTGTLATLGAVVVKSLSVEPWPGNPAPRVHEVGAGMLNSVGLQGPGLAAWMADDLPALRDAGARWW